MIRRKPEVLKALLLIALHSSLAYSQSLAERAERGEFAVAFDAAPNEQILATLNTFFGRSDLNADFPEIPQASRSCPLEGATDMSGRQWILANARVTKVLMFNENHYGIGERVFVRTLLPELRNMGFTHLGLEAFNNSASDDDGQHKPGSGFYTIEPTFVGLLREAEAAGFEIFGYEPRIEASEDLDREERFALRESGQAANIQAQIDAAPEDARFIIYAGWSHIAEQPVSAPGGTGRWMAARFKKNTGIDPLTIDLTACVYESKDPQNLRGRIVLAADGTPLVFGRDPHAFDAQIRLPIPPRNHPVTAGFYRQTLGQAVIVPEKLRPADEPVLVQARKLPMLDGEVAHDRVLLHPGEHLPLYLPPGEYELQAHRGDGEIVGQMRIGVE